MSKDGFSSFIIQGDGSIFSEGLDEKTATRVVRDALAPQVRAAVVEKLREVPAAVQVLGDLAVLLGGAVVLEVRADGMSRLRLLVKLPDAPAPSTSEAPGEAAPPAAVRPPRPGCVYCRCPACREEHAQRREQAAAPHAWVKPGVLIQRKGKPDAAPVHEVWSVDEEDLLIYIGRPRPADKEAPHGWLPLAQFLDEWEPAPSTSEARS